MTGVAMAKGSQPQGEEGDVAGPWAAPASMSVHGCLTQEREAARRWDLWGASWGREKASFSWLCIT